jgi:hypothetical protein
VPREEGRLPNSRILGRLLFWAASRPLPRMQTSRSGQPVSQPSSVNAVGAQASMPIAPAASPSAVTRWSACFPRPLSAGPAPSKSTDNMGPHVSVSAPPQLSAHRNTWGTAQQLAFCQPYRRPRTPEDRPTSWTSSLLVGASTLVSTFALHGSRRPLQLCDWRHDIDCDCDSTR